MTYPQQPANDAHGQQGIQYPQVTQQPPQQQQWPAPVAGLAPVPGMAPAGYQPQPAPQPGQSQPQFPVPTPQQLAVQPQPYMLPAPPVPTYQPGQPGQPYQAGQLYQPAHAAPAAPPAMPQVPFPVQQQPAPPAQQGQPVGSQPGTTTSQGQTPGTGTDLGYPPDTPIAEMTAEQQAAYWKYHARKHEQRVRDMGDYDQLRAMAGQYQALVEASRTDQERAAATAYQQGYGQAVATMGGVLVEAHVRAAAAGRLTDERVNALLEGLDRSRFLAPDGRIDTDRLYAYVHALAPAPQAPPAPTTVPVPTPGVPGQMPQLQTAPTGVPVPSALPLAPSGLPDFGQGQPQTAPLSGLEAGKAAARARYGNKQPTRQQ